MAISNKANMVTNQTSGGGGSARITLAASVGQGTDVDCRYCRIQAATGNSGTTRVRIGGACTSTTGVAVPAYPTLTPYTVDNLSKLYFSGTTNDIIDIEYFL